MPISIISDTRQVLGDSANGCASRSLFNDRFANPQAKEDERKRWFGDLLKKSAEKIVQTDWLPANAEILHARLMSRLMVDLAGGVMENANINLDRYGLPYIPGSAVKGCARRMALQALHDWVAAGTERLDKGDACAPCCEDFASPAHMLATIARVFGWVETDWSEGKNREKKNGQWVETTWKSDFAWACAAAPAPTGQNIPAQGNALGTATPTNPSPDRATQNIRTLFAAARALLPDHKAFAGTIAFLPASPNRDPGLELDVVTPHHTAYYQGELQTATDTEDPIPVYFPAVKPQKDGDHFTFLLIPLRLAASGDLAHAKNWLAHGLELFGLGAKTAAGYGWFQIISDEAKAAAEQSATVAASDYGNEIIFKNTVLNKLNPGALNQLEPEIKKLAKLENEAWRKKFVETLKTKDMKDLRKRLKDKDWFPKDWLP